MSKKVLVWVLVSSVSWVGLKMFLPTSDQAFAIAALVAAIVGTILFGEERLPFVVGGVLLLVASGTSDFYYFITGMEWILFVKLVSLLVWVDYLARVRYFDSLIQEFLPEGIRGWALLGFVFVMSAISAALIDEVNSILIWYAVMRSIVGFEQGKLRISNSSWKTIVVLMVSATNIGSQLLPLGNPVGIAVSSISGLQALDFLKYAWPPAIVTLIWFLIRVRITQRTTIREFLRVTVEEAGFTRLQKEPESTIEVMEIGEHEVKPPTRILHLLFAAGVVGLVVAEPVGGFMGLENGNGLGIVAMMLLAITLYIASYFKKHNEVVLAELPWSTLLFIVFLFGIAHVLETTGVTELMTNNILNLVGSNLIALVVVIAIIAGIVTAVMDNVIAIAVLSGIIIQLEQEGIPVTVLWFVLLSAGVVAANATPIGSAANIIANARARLSWGEWWRGGGYLALECTAINVAALYIWIEIILK